MKVFISHSSKDKRFVRKLKECLSENCIDTWLDEDQLDFGDSLITKLEHALEDSTHLVIVLSPSSVESDWVKFELKKALKNNKTGLINKIIPIKYRQCKLPEELSDLIYADLSDEVVLPEGENLKFISTGFESFFLKLVRAIRQSELAMNKEEKAEIIKSIKSSEKEILEFNRTIYRGNLKLLSYSSVQSREKYQSKIQKQLNSKLALNEYRPMLLPASIKNFMDIKIGDRLKIEDELFLESFCHFAGYRIDDLAIVIEKRTRDELQLISGQYYQVEIDLDKSVIKFVSKIKTSTNSS
jgi:hypothetical protein